jgi:hypothetical protein
MAKKKKRVFDRFQVVREMARERIGQPKPSAVLKDKRRQILARIEKRELSERN